MRRIGSVIFVLCVLLWACPAAAQSNEKKEAAITTALEWLALIDAGRYGQSWQESVIYFRNAVARDHWE